MSVQLNYMKKSKQLLRELDQRGQAVFLGYLRTFLIRHSRQGEGGQADRGDNGISRRPAQSAAEGRGPGIAVSSEVECGMAGKARQWQHAGNNAGKGDAMGLLRGGLPAAFAFARDALVPRTLREG